MAGVTADPITNSEGKVDMWLLVEILQRVDLINPVIRLMLEFESRTGLRYVDSSRITWKEVKINGVWRRSFTIVQSKSFNKRLSNIRKANNGVVSKTAEANAKAASEKVVDVTDEMVDLLEDLEQFTGGKKVLFESSHHLATPGNAITIAYINRVLKRVALDMKLQFNLSTHSMRKTFTLILLENKVNMRDLRDMLGHSSLAVTDHYVGKLVGNSREVANLISYKVA